MQYVVVPWTDETKRNTLRSSAEDRSLSFNLALWFVHVLAASQYKIGWDYGPLRSEKLLKVACNDLQIPITPESQARPSRSNKRQVTARRTSRKRTRNEPDDQFVLSFHEASSPKFFSSFQVRQINDMILLVIRCLALN